MTINWVFTDLNERYAMTLNNSALTYRADAAHAGSMATLRLSKPVPNGIFTGKMKMSYAISQGQLEVTGDR